VGRSKTKLPAANATLFKAQFATSYCHPAATHAKPVPSQSLLLLFTIVDAATHGEFNSHLMEVNRVSFLPAFDCAA
jgi:hypothetical protein